MRKRDLSEFMTIELLYDYKIGKLDAIRAAAIQEGLKNSAIARAELGKLDSGLEFCNELQKIEVSDEFIKALTDQPTIVDKMLHYLKWRNIPQSVKWTFEALLVACSITLFIIQFPKFFDSDKDDKSPIIAQTIEYKRPRPQDLEVIKSKIELPTTSRPVTELGADSQPEIPIEAPQTIADLPIPAPVPEMPSQKVAKAKPVAKPVQAVAQEPATQEVDEEAVAAPAKTESIRPHRVGYIHRISINTANVDDITPEVTDMIESLGGKKAGEVELGWKKQNGSYYHFTIPEENYDLLVDRLKKYGEFTVEKTEHPRIMPEGLLRFIVWIEKTP